MLCVRRMMALSAACVLIAMAGCGGNRIEIMKIEPTSLTLNTKDSVSPFTVTAYNAKNEVVPAPTIAWSTSDSLTLLVDQTGRVTPMKSGMATVTAAAGNAKADVPVTVALFTSLALPDTAMELVVSEGRQLDARILNETGVEIEGPLMWESEDRAIVEVTPEGMVTGMAPGQTTISVRTKGVPAVQLPVTVVAPKPAKGRGGR
ncbi:Ig-like domain-containing protein [Candidatus Fermentibacteria bacterium]|nr:Ig-like domain-containing protein [Candidatus Fermentibacteria bacterium]